MQRRDKMRKGKRDEVIAVSYLVSFRLMQEAEQWRETNFEPNSAITRAISNASALGINAVMHFRVAFTCGICEIA